MAELDAAGTQSCDRDRHGMCRAGRSGRISERASAMTSKELGKMAMNTANFEDEIVYRGFVKDVQEDDYEFDDRWVMIAPLGEYVGANTKGEQLEEKLTPEAFEAIVMAFHQKDLQIPLDKDHASLKEPLHRDTQAYGWIKDLRLMSGGADDYNGLYAKIEWTPEGMALVTTKAYRFLSPVFVLDEEGHPTQLVNVALTNRPNFDLPPIFNTISEEDNLIEDPTMDIEKFKNEIVEAVVNAIAEKKADETAACNEEEKVEETKEETSCNETAEEKTEEKVEEAEEKAEETKEEVKEEEKEDKEDKEEVIKPEVLNTMPTTITPEIDRLERVEEWRNLKGDDLMAYAYKRTCRNMRAAMAK